VSFHNEKYRVAFDQLEPIDRGRCKAHKKFGAGVYYNHRLAIGSSNAPNDCRNNVGGRHSLGTLCTYEDIAGANTHLQWLT
jgi:hypothetical protein